MYTMNTLYAFLHSPLLVDNRHTVYLYFGSFRTGRGGLNHKHS